MNPSTTITSIIQELLFNALRKIELSVDSPDSIIIEKPANNLFGDFSSNIAMRFFKQQSQEKSPLGLAKIIINQISNADTQKYFKKIEPAGNGFINFYLSDDYLFKQISTDFSDLTSQAKIENTKKIIVEYSSPNIAKPFTIGHLRSTIIGDSIANILEYVGHQVFRDNHLGDWGTQFGKQIYAIKTWGSEEEIDKLDRPVKKLVELYVKFHHEAEQNPDIEEEGRKWFKKLEDGDQEARRLWQKCIDWSWKEFQAIYDKLGVKFTENDGKGYGESFFEDKMSEVVDELRSNNLLTNSQDASLVFFPEEKFPPMMILKKDGATLYATRDLATDKFRLKKYGNDIVIINEVGSEQSLYFQQLFEIEKMLGWITQDQRVHVKHGLYRFADKKMSTRKGNVIWLEEVLQEAFDRIRKISNTDLPDDDVWTIAIGAIKWNDLKNKAVLNTTFDWNEILRVDGNSGPYIQYTYSRCRSVLEKSKIRTISTAELDIEHLSLNDEEKSLVSQILLFPETIQRSAQELSPHYLCTYLFELSQKFNVFYNKHSILEDSKMRDFRIHLSHMVQSILKDGLKNLGIGVPSRM